MQSSSQQLKNTNALPNNDIKTISNHIQSLSYCWYLPHLQSWWSWSCRPGCPSAARLRLNLCRGQSSVSFLRLLRTGNCCGFPTCCRRPQRSRCWCSDSCSTSGSSGLWVWQAGPVNLSYLCKPCQRRRWCLPSADITIPRVTKDLLILEPSVSLSLQ